MRARKMKMMRIRNAVVPVAGLGTRMLPATKSQPKEMLPVGRKPVVQYVVEELEANGLERVLFITGATKASIENHFDPDPILTRHLRESGKEELLEELGFEMSSMHFFYTRQKSQRGLGDAIAHAHAFCSDEPFAVALGDSILGLRGQSQAMRHMARLFEEKAAPDPQKLAAIIAFETVPLEEVHQYGVAQVLELGGGQVLGENEVFRVADLIEKPSRAEAPSRLAIAARYVFSPAIFDALKETKPGRGGEIQLTDAVRLLIAEGREVWGVHLGPADRRYDIGNFDDYFSTFLEFALADPKHGAALKTKLRALLAE
jgi:UTP--glucose-1-phosphate uridylyltransferase